MCSSAGSNTHTATSSTTEITVLTDSRWLQDCFECFTDNKWAWMRWADTMPPAGLFSYQSWVVFGNAIVYTLYVTVLVCHKSGVVFGNVCVHAVCHCHWGSGRCVPVFQTGVKDWTDYSWEIDAKCINHVTYIQQTFALDLWLCLVRITMKHYFNRLTQSRPFLLIMHYVISYFINVTDTVMSSIWLCVCCA